ncbi:hypothetical protein, partial [Rhizobium sp. 18055]|uniref:hypothetical protein n=1 Tax=Rhizobium sp. 18055 TaxID=2681403 RepID=UPI001AED1633
VAARPGEAAAAAVAAAGERFGLTPGERFGLTPGERFGLTPGERFGLTFSSSALNRQTETRKGRA